MQGEWVVGCGWQVGCRCKVGKWLVVGGRWMGGWMLVESGSVVGDSVQGEREIVIEKPWWGIKSGGYYFKINIL